MVDLERRRRAATSTRFSSFIIGFSINLNALARSIDQRPGADSGGSAASRTPLGEAPRFTFYQPMPENPKSGKNLHARR
jgi:hypothetical protein